MNKSVLLFTTWVVVMYGCTAGWAQMPTDALMMSPRQACLLADYNFGSFDHYWEGTQLRDNQTIATVRRTTVTAMAAIGVAKKLNLYVALPFVKTKSSEINGGRFAGVSGLQDVSVALKYRLLDHQKNDHSLTVLTTVGFSTPASNYLPDYMPYSLGLGATELSYRAIGQYTSKNGAYLRGSAAYLWRGYAKAERNYYYNGGSYYTPFMDVPNALLVEVGAGTSLWSKTLRVEVNYVSSNATFGDDIRSYNAPQPTNKIRFGRVGVLANYQFPNLKGVGIVLNANRVITGRNTAEITTAGIGVTYLFNYLK